MIHGSNYDDVINKSVQIYNFCPCAVCIQTIIFYSSTETVYIVGLDGEIKSNRLNDTTFSLDVESIGENITYVKVNIMDIYLDTDSVCLFVRPVYFEDTLLAVWRHGWQRRRQGFTEVLQEITDPRKIYRLVQSDKYDLYCLNV